MLIHAIINTALLLSASLASPRPTHRTVVLDSAAIDSAIFSEMRATRTPGVALAIVRGNQVIYSRGYGVRSAEEPEPVTASTLFRIGSITKTVTGFTAQLLVASGRLGLDTPIHRYAPELKAPIRNLTMRQLLSHTAGLIQEASNNGSHDDGALAARVERWDARETFAPAGDIYSYSSPGYWLAGYIVQRIAGKPYADAVRQGLLSPLGMTRSTFRPLEAMTYPLALDHRVDSLGARVLRPYVDDASTWPAGSLFSSANDLARLAVALMNDGAVDGSQRVSSAAVRAMHTALARVPGDGDDRCSYTSGLSLCERRGTKSLSHYGFRAGSGAVFSMRPDARVAVIILANRSGGIFARSERRIFDILLGAQAAEPQRTAPASTLTRQQVAATFASGADTIRITLRRDSLFYRYARLPEQPLRLGSGNTIEVLGSNGDVEQQFMIVAGKSGILYLHDGLNAFRRLGTTVVRRSQPE